MSISYPVGDGTAGAASIPYPASPLVDPNLYPPVRYGIPRDMPTKPDVGFAVFCELYTTNKLTLSQAAYSMASYLARASSYGDPAIHSARILEILGHRMHPNDHAAIELGYDGSVQAWLDAGNLPRGWHGLFKHNYAWYNPESERCILPTTEPVTKTTAPV